MSPRWSKSRLARIGWLTRGVGQRPAFGERVGRHEVRIVDGQRSRASDCSGRRKPSGESPGTRNSRPRRVRHISLSQPGFACAVQRCSGSTKPAGSPRWLSNTRRMRARSSRIVDLGIARIDVLRDQTLLEHAVGRVLVGGLHVVRRDAEARGNAFGETPRIVGRRLVRRRLRARSGCRRARSARRRGASRARTPSAAAARRDTTCPGRNAGARPARSGRAGAGSARRRARASSGRARRCSIPPTDNRRPRRRSARRPWSGARRARRDRRRPSRRARRARSRPRRKTAWSRAAVRRSRLTLISKREANLGAARRGR